MEGDARFGMSARSDAPRSFGPLPEGRPLRSFGGDRIYTADDPWPPAPGLGITGRGSVFPREDSEDHADDVFDNDNWFLQFWNQATNSWDEAILMEGIDNYPGEDEFGLYCEVAYLLDPTLSDGRAVQGEDEFKGFNDYNTVHRQRSGRRVFVDDGRKFTILPNRNVVVGQGPYLLKYQIFLCSANRNGAVDSDKYMYFEFVKSSVRNRLMPFWRNANRGTPVERRVYQTSVISDVLIGPAQFMREVGDVDKYNDNPAQVAEDFRLAGSRNMALEAIEERRHALRGADLLYQSDKEYWPTANHPNPSTPGNRLVPYGTPPASPSAQMEDV